MKKFTNSNWIIFKFWITLSALIFCFSPEIQAQTDQFQNLPQYLFPEFSPGMVKMKVGNNLTTILNYNIVTGKMVFSQKDQVFDLVNPDMVDTVFLNSRKFIPVGKVFYEVIMEKPIALFIEHKGKVLEPGKPAAYGGTSQLSSSNYVTNLPNDASVYNIKLPDDYTVESDPVYWIFMNGNKYNFINERQFTKFFRGRETDIKEFVKKNRIKFDNPQDVKKLVSFCSSFIEKV